MSAHVLLLSVVNALLEMKQHMIPKNSQERHTLYHAVTICDCQCAHVPFCPRFTKSVNLDHFRNRIARDDKIRNPLFSNYLAYPAVEAAYKDESEKAQAGSVPSAPSAQAAPRP